jgi:hypothetical protein
MKAATLTVLAMLSAVPMVGIAAQPGEGNSDHQQMLAKLKITSPLRPGPAGRLNADGTVPPNYANYDESKATAGSPVPPLLVMNDGRKITTLTMWEERRKELFEILDREFYGRQRSVEVWNDLLFRRKKPFALIDVNARRFGRAKLNRIWMDLEARCFLGANGSDCLKKILIELVDWSQGVYGTVYYSGQAHKRIVQMTPLERLDQAYWLTFFGEPYLDMFGKEKLLSVQCHSIEEFKNGIIMQAAPRFDSPEMIDSDELLTRIRITILSLSMSLTLKCANSARRTPVAYSVISMTL